MGWRQVAASFLLLGCMSMIASSYGVIAVPIGAEFKPTRFVLMLAMTVLSLSCGLLSPFLGSLMDRISLRKIMLAGAAFLVVGYLALSFATSFPVVLAIFGLLIAPANVLLGPLSASVLLSRWFVQRRGLAIGIGMAGISAGTFAFSPLIAALLEAFAWREALRVLAVILAAITIPAALLIVNSPADKGLNPDGAADLPQKAAGNSAAPVLVTARSILGDPSFWLLAAIVGVISSAMKGTVANLAPLAIDEGIRPADAAFLVSIFAGCGFISKFVFAVLADRLSPKILLLVVLGGCGCAMATLVRAEAGYATIAAGVALLGLAGGLIVPVQSFLVPRIFGSHAVGKTLGLMNSVLLVLLMLTPPVFGWIFDKTGNYDIMFMIFVGVSAAAMLAIPGLRLHQRGEAPVTLQASS